MYNQTTKAGVDLPELRADIKRMIKLADDVGRSRQSNCYAMNSGAVEKLVDLEASVLAQVSALARQQTPVTGKMDYRTCCDHPDCATCAGHGGFYRLSAPATHQATLAAPAEQQSDEVARLRKALVEVGNALQAANESPNGGINDTLWMTHGGAPETVFDFIDATLASASPPKPAASQQAGAHLIVPVGDFAAPITLPAGPLHIGVVPPAATTASASEPQRRYCRTCDMDVSKPCDDPECRAPAPSQEAAQASHAGAVSDTERLDFMASHEAWIGWTKDGESCRVFVRNEDGDAAPLMGWVPEAWGHSAREAIDAAIAATTQQKGQQS